MELDYINLIKTQFRNITLNSTGVAHEVYELIAKREIFALVNMMTSNEREVDNAIREYNPQTHPVMRRANKPRKDKTTYITEKLPRNKQQYINEIELFFLLGKPIVWKRESGDDEAYRLFLKFWRDKRMDSVLRKAKRLAGSETESSVMFNIVRDGKTVNAQPYVASRTQGYRTRTLFDQYGTLVAHGLGYRLREGKSNILHWDIHTKDFLFRCANRKEGWEVETFANPTGKINGVYFHQLKAWDGVVPRIEREEKLDSKVGDTNNYFADPKAAATADVVANIMDPEIAGQMVQLSGKESRFEYINPPQNSVTRQDEKRDLQNSIFFDTFTPDFSYESIKGLGTLSGAAIRNALVLGYIKRDNRKELYGEMIDRLKNVILEMLKLMYPEHASHFSQLELSFEFSDPFATREDNWKSIIQLYGAGLCSLETAIKEIALVDDVDKEIDRLKMAAAELEFVRNEAQGNTQAGTAEETEE